MLRLKSLPRTIIHVPVPHLMRYRGHTFRGRPGRGWLSSSAKSVTMRS